MPKLELAVISRPGVFIEDELNERGWTQLDLAEILARPPRLISELIQGKRAVTLETANGLAQAFGNEPEFWLNLETLYQVSKYKQSDIDVARRSNLYSRFPVREMTKRNWISNSENVEQLEREFLSFFKIPNFEETPKLNSYLRKSGSYESDLDITEKAWLFRICQLAESQKVSNFTSKKLERAFKELKLLLKNDEVARIPKILNNAGIKFLIVEALPKTRIDGVCFWMNENKNPVIALSIRFDRIDSFWFTLLHELAHLYYGDGKDDISPDINLVGKNAQKTSEKPPVEKRADEFASNFIIDEQSLIYFADKIHPYFSKTRIQLFAEEMGIHPGLVVGQLQHKGYIPYSHSRDMLVNIREKLMPISLVDGWGNVPI